MKATIHIPLTLFGTLLVLTGCVSPLPSSKEALAPGRNGDGVVLGSVLLLLEGVPVATNNCSLEVKLRGPGQSARHRYNFTSPSNQGKLFDGSLPAGDYWVDSIHWRVSIPSGSLSAHEKLLRDWYKEGRCYGNEVHPAARFQVNPGQTTYIGQLVVNLPRHSEIGSRFTVEVRDEEPKTREELSNQDSPLLLSQLQKKLMTPTSRDLPLLVQADSVDSGYIYNPVDFKTPCHQSSGHSSHEGQRYSAPSGVGHSPSIGHSPSMGSFGHGGRF